MYPTNIQNWNAFRFPEVLDTYVSFKEKRITDTKPGMKKYPKGSPEWNEFSQKDQFYKLILNGVSGLLDMEYSWLYNNKPIMKVRCGGQLILLWIIDRCVLNGIDVISVNTDGLEIKIKKSLIPTYLEIISQAEQKFNVVFERDYYKKIVYQNVNSYIALTESGKIKEKGSTFLTNPDLGNSVDFLVIPKTLKQYFIYGIKPKTFLDDPNNGLHIYDFCCSAKVDRSYTVEWMGQKQQRLNRFYVSKNGGYIYKCRKGTKTHMLKGWGVMIYNNHVEKPLSEYNIDMRFYLNEANSMIAELENKNQYELI